MGILLPKPVKYVAVGNGRDKILKARAGPAPTDPYIKGEIKVGAKVSLLTVCELPYTDRIDPCIDPVFMR